MRTFREWMEVFGGTYALHPYYHHLQSQTEYMRRFEVDGDWYVFEADLQKGRAWEVSFYKEGQQKVDSTNLGHAPRVLGSVIEIMRDFIRRRDPEVIEMYADKARFPVYERMIARFAGEMGYELDRRRRSVYQVVPGLPFFGTIMVPGRGRPKKKAAILNGKPLILVKKSPAGAD